MAIKITLESFLAVLRRSGLIEADLIQRLVDEFRAAHGEPPDAKPFADLLVERKLISPWQADKLLVGKHKGFFLGKYKLKGLLGKGGMSSVYLAEHVLMRRMCAIKVLPARRVNDASYLGRFHREAQAVAALDHPNIVRAYDVDHEKDGEFEIHFLVMEYVEGKSLLDMVAERGPLGPVEAAQYIRQAALGLHHAHGAGIIHRDIKPGNLLVDTTGTVKLLDMGLARFFGGDDAQSLTIQHDEKVLGTADYLAPEQAVDSHKVDRRVDIYSLGCTLFFLFTAQPPFNEGTLTQRLMAHQLKDPKAITDFRADVPESLLAIMRKMMAKKPEDRYPTAKETADALSDWLLRQGAVMPEATSDSGPLNLSAAVPTPAPAPAPAVPPPAAVVSPPVAAGVPDFFGIGASAAEPVPDAPGDFANLFGGGPEPASAPAAAKAPVRTATAKPAPAPSPTPAPKPASGTKPGKKNSAAEMEVPSFFGGTAGNNGGSGGGGEAPAEVGHFTDLFTGESPKPGPGAGRAATNAPAPVATPNAAEPDVPDFLRAAAAPPAPAPAQSRTAPAKAAPGKPAAARSPATPAAPKPTAKIPAAPAAKAPAAAPPRAADDAPPFLAGAAPAPASDNPFGADLFGFQSASNETAAPAAPAPTPPAAAPKPAAKPAAAAAPPAPKPAATPPAPVAEGVPDFLSSMTAEPAGEPPAGDDPFGFHAAPPAPAAPAAKAPVPPKPAAKPPAATPPKAAPAATAPAKAAPAPPPPARPAPAAEEVPAFLNASASAPADEAAPMGDLFGFGAPAEPAAPAPPVPKPAAQPPAKPAAARAPAATPPSPDPAPSAPPAPPKPAAKAPPAAAPMPAAAPADEMPAFLGGVADSPVGESENPFGAEMFGIGTAAAEPPAPPPPAPSAPVRQGPPAKGAASPPPPAAAPAPPPKAKPTPKAAPAPAKPAVEVPAFLQAGGEFADSATASAPAATEPSPFAAAAPSSSESPADDSPFSGSETEDRATTPVRPAKKAGPSPLAGVQAWLQVPKNRLIAGGAAAALVLIIGALAFIPAGKPKTTGTGTGPAAAAPAPGAGGAPVAASSVRQATVRPRPQGETITVGPEGNFGTVSEAVSYFMRNIPSDGSRRTIRVAGGYSYSESITIAAAIGISSPLTITSDAAQPAVLTPRGGGVIMNIPFATDLILENLVFDAGGAPNCAQLEVLGTGSQLKNVEFRGFRENGLVIASVPGDQAAPVLVDGCRFKGFDPGAKGLVFKTSADNLFGLTVTNSQFSAPMRTGIEVGSASVSSFQVTNCRFVDVRTGLLFPAPKQEIEDVLILNNTFYKAADAIVFNHAPDAKRPMKSALIGNLFAGSTTTDVSIRSGFTKQQWDQFQAGGPGIAGNMSQREGELGANEVDVFGQGGKRPLKELSFVSTTPGTPEFLKPTGANVSFTKAKAGNGWAGAVQP